MFKGFFELRCINFILFEGIFRVIVSWEYNFFVIVRSLDFLLVSLVCGLDRILLILMFRFYRFFFNDKMLFFFLGCSV